jgi:GAF domain-containing protein
MSMSQFSGGLAEGDYQRDAIRYHRLLLTLQQATDKVLRMEAKDLHDLDEVFGQLLPDLANAFNGQQAFVAVAEGDDRTEGLTVADAWPNNDLVDETIPWTEIMQRLVDSGKPVVHDPPEADILSTIPGLEIFEATSVMMVPLQSPSGVWVVGICNKADPSRDLFLVPDRMALESLVELVAIGFRAGQRRRRELEGIGSTAAAISTDLDIDQVLDMTVARTVKLFDACASSYMFWDAARKNLVIEASHGLSPKYVQQQRIPKAKVRAQEKILGGYRPFATPDLQQAPFGNKELILKEDLRTTLTAPLVVGTDLIGLLNVYYRGQPRDHSANELELLGILASHTAIAIRSRRLLEKEKRRTQELLAVSDVSAALTSSLDPQQVLEQIADSLIQVRGYEKVAIFMVDHSQGTLNLEMARNLSADYVAQSSSLLIAPDSRGAAVFEGCPITVPDIQTNLRFAAYREMARQEGFRAFIDMPMIAKEKTIGAICAYYSRPHRFSEEEVNLLLTLANHAATAVQNAREYEILRQAQEDLSAASTVAWLGMPAAVWSHSVNQRTSAIRYNVDTLRDLLQVQDEIVNETLDDIKQAARYIENTPLEGPLPAQSHGVVDPASVDQVLDTWIPRWCSDHPDIEVDLRLHAGDALTAINEEWLTAALRKPVFNALKAMPDGGVLTVTSGVVEDQIHVVLEDTGIGIPQEALPYFLKARVPRHVRLDKTGSGMGVLLARFILRSFGGDMELISEDRSEGTALRIILPLFQGA